MPKKSRKKPGRSKAQPRSPQKTPQSSEKQEGIEGRRKVLAALGLGLGAMVAWRTGLFKLLEEEEEVAPSSPQPPPEKKPIESGELFPGIKIPKMEFGSRKIDLKTHLLPQAPDEFLEVFKKVIEEGEAELKKSLERAKSPEKKFELIAGFLNRLFAESSHIISYPRGGGTEIGSLESYQQITHLNKALIAAGYYLSLRYDPATKNLDLAVLDTKNADTMEIEADGEKFTVPIIKAGNQRDYYSQGPEDTLDLAALYEFTSDVIVVDPHGVERQFGALIDTQKKRISRAGGTARKVDLTDSAKVIQYHEGMHAAFGRILHKRGISGNILERGIIKKRGPIDMDGYVLPEKFYKNLSVGELHEIAGHGYELMRAKGSARLMAHASLTTGKTAGKVKGKANYEPTSDFIVNEILRMAQRKGMDFSSLITPEGSSSTVEVNGLLELMNHFSEEELNAIGRRMTEFAIYLTQN